MPIGWNFADVWETVAQAAPDRPAQIHGDQVVSWREFDRRANGIAWTFLDNGLAHQDKVALYLLNCPQYLQGAFACMKAGMVPVNTNYRYQHDELHYLWDNADAAAVVFHGSFTSMVDAVRPRCDKVRLWIHVDDGTAPCPDWALPYEACATRRQSRALGQHGRSGDDLILIYTGGTTGKPRGVMWRQHDLYVSSNTAGDPAQPDLAHVRQRILETVSPRDAQAVDASPIGLPAAPLMHGTAFVFASAILTRGGAVLTLTGKQFDVDELIDAIQAHRVTDLCIVGDAFGRPMVDALDAAVPPRDISSLKAVSSSGMMWNPANKQRLLRHTPDAILVDFLNSSEASGMGRAVTSRKKSNPSGHFKLGKNAIVIDADNRPVAPGSGVAGRIAVGGPVPLGYYGDPEKTAATFPVIDGVRYAIPGDFATVQADGSITLLGRGSVSINTGGEKVYPEEVEERIKLLDQVRDAVVVGVPDERFGETVAAIVEPVPGQHVSLQALAEHVRSGLARHKAPRHLLLVDSIGRGPNGKADYPALRRQMIDSPSHATPTVQEQ